MAARDGPVGRGPTHRAADPARRLLAQAAVARGTGGVVGACSSVAAAIGSAALLAGGNCVDAALHAALAETVTLAPKCGLAGDLVALHLAPGRDVPDALVAVGPAALGLADAVRRLGELPLTGGLSVGVPGAPAGYAALARRSRLGLAAACAPAADLARRGFSWPHIGAALSLEADELLVAHQPAGSRFRPSHGPLMAGELVRLPGAAALLHRFAELGEGLFDGPIGDALVARVAACGGVITRDDLASATAEWSRPTAAAVGDASILVTPEPTHGPALVDALRRWSSGDATGLVGAVRTALEHRARAQGEGGASGEGTSVVAATDREGGAVVVVHSLSFPQFGSGIVVDEHDLICSNRAGRGFSANPSSPGFPVPGARPPTTLHAWMLRSPRRRQPLLGATPGGAHQVGWNAQCLVSLLEGEDSLGAAVTAPRWRLEGDGITVEEDATGPAAAGAARRCLPLSMRSSQIVLAPAPPGALAEVAVDPRLGGVALAP